MDTRETASTSEVRILIFWLLSIGPHTVGAFHELHSRVSIAKAVDILADELEVHLDVLVCEDESLVSTVKEPVAWICYIPHLEAKVFIGFLEKLEAVHIEPHVAIQVVSGDYRLWDRKSGLVRG